MTQLVAAWKAVPFHTLRSASVSAAAPVAAPLSVCHQPSMLTGVAPVLRSSTASPKPGLPGSVALSEAISLISTESQLGSSVGVTGGATVQMLTAPLVAAVTWNAPVPLAQRPHVDAW